MENLKLSLISWGKFSKEKSCQIGWVTEGKFGMNFQFYRFELLISNYSRLFTFAMGKTSQTTFYIEHSLCSPTRVENFVLLKCMEIIFKRHLFNLNFLPIWPFKEFIYLKNLSVWREWSHATKIKILKNKLFTLVLQQFPHLLQRLELLVQGYLDLLLVRPWNLRKQIKIDFLLNSIINQSTHVNRHSFDGKLEKYLFSAGKQFRHIACKWIYEIRLEFSRVCRKVFGHKGFWTRVWISYEERSINILNSIKIQCHQILV